jgi:hypothetical protein
MHEIRVGIEPMEGRPVTVGDLFRPEDEIGQWVFALSAAVEDLALAEVAFKAELEAERPGDAVPA